MTEYQFPPGKWRLIDDNAYPVQLGLAIDEILFNQLDKCEDEDKTSNIIRFYQFSPPSVVMGCHQDVREINLDFIRSRGLEIGRRITGGGSIIMGIPNVDSQLGISIVLHITDDFPRKLGTRYAILASGIIGALQKLGINAEYQSNSDITVDGRKITGQASYLTRDVFFLHSTINLDYNLEMMLQVMGLAPNQTNISRFRSKFTTIKEQIPSITMKKLKEGLIEVFKNKFNARLHMDPLSSEELVEARKLYETKHSTQEYLFNLDGSTMGSCFL